MLMGKQLAGLPGEIVGIPIAWPAAKVRDSYRADHGHAAIRRFGSPIEGAEVIPSDRRLSGAGAGDRGRRRAGDHRALGPGDEGAVLDPVYTAKAFAGLVTTLEKDPKALGRGSASSIP